MAIFQNLPPPPQLVFVLLEGGRVGYYMGGQYKREEEEEEVEEEEEKEEEEEEECVHLVCLAYKDNKARRKWSSVTKRRHNDSRPRPRQRGRWVM
jgi:hypothetical protein